MLQNRSDVSIEDSEQLNSGWFLTALIYSKTESNQAFECYLKRFQQILFQELLKDKTS